MSEQIISHYRLIREIGAGGMGVVHEAEDLILGRHVALKLLPERMANEDAVERFRREARAASSLNHPAICTIYEIGSDDGRHFISMELLEGESLALRIAHGPFELRELAEFALHISDGLDAAHLKGIIHRDLKPANLFITKYRQGKILDFGLAKLVDDRTMGPEAVTAEAPLTRPNALVGTLEFMSPEQARGAVLDARTDIFSFGEVLYEMATGRRPFYASTPALLFDAILNSDPAPPRTINPSVPPLLEEIILRMMEKDPDFRLVSAAAVRTEFMRLLRDIELGPVRLADYPDTERRVSPTRNSASSRSVSTVKSQKMRRKGIAVLPFANDSGNPELEYLSDGLTEVLINQLSTIPELRTVPRAVAFHFKGQGFDPARIAKELKVRTVVTGRLSRRGPRLNIGVELLDLTSIDQIWGQQYSAKEEDVVGLDGVIAGDITAALRLKLTSDATSRLSRRQTSNSRAFELYLKGRHAYATFLPESVNQSIELARQAIQLDPMFASAYALTADAYALCGYFRYRPPEDVFPKAKAAALRALELDSTLGEPHAALGLVYYIYEWDWSRAEQAFRRAAELQAEGLGGGTSYAFLKLTLGRADQAIALCERALNVDPLSAPVAAAAAWIYLSAGELEKALRQGRNAQELDPQIYHNPELIPVDIMIDLFSGRSQDALMKYQELLAESNMDVTKSALPYVLAHAGYKDEVRNMLQVADLTQADPGKLAMVYAALGDYDLAFEWLEKGLHGHFRAMLGIKTTPDFVPMHGDPRYADLLRRMNLPL